jgi:nucleoside-diphosphate-sugar epimerase
MAGCCSSREPPGTSVARWSIWPFAAATPYGPSSRDAGRAAELLPAGVDVLVTDLAERPVGPPALTDPYSVSKAAAEDLVLAAAGNGLAAVLVSPVNIYGPSRRVLNNSARSGAQ